MEFRQRIDTPLMTASHYLMHFTFEYWENNTEVTETVGADKYDE